MRSRFPSRKYVFISSIVLLAQLVYGAINTRPTTDVDSSLSGHAAVGSATLSNCSEPTVDQFPKSYFTFEERKSGWLILHVICATYMCVALSTLCDEFFIPAVEVLTESLGINDGVAGATFMAGASSVPAIAASLIAILVAKGDLGVSTALGSAVLNTAGVVGAGAFFAREMTMLSRWPLYRDVVFCFVSMFVMVITMYDSIIMWYESTILLSFYILYIVFMIYDDTLKAVCEKRLSFLRDKPPSKQKNFASEAQNTQLPISLTVRGFDAQSGDMTRLGNNSSSSPSRSRAINGAEALRNGGAAFEMTNGVEAGANASASLAPKTEEKSTGLWAYFEGKLKPPSNKFLLVPWVSYLPFTVLFVFTIPNCARPSFRNLWAITLCVSTFYITVASYILVWMIAVIGFTLSIPDAAMGLTALAIGVTLPDVVIGVISTRRGHPDMAMSNAIASNIVEILVGLAVPWLVKSLFITPGEPIVLESRGMIWFTIYLLVSLVFLIVLTNMFDWVLTKLYGATLLTFYVVFLVVSVLHEMGYLGGERLIVCPSSY